MPKIYDSQIPAWNTIMTALDILNDVKKLDILLENISDEERQDLYDHPLLNDENGKFNEIGNQLLP